MAAFDFTVVVPCYNEKSAIDHRPKTLEAIVRQDKSILLFMLS